MPVVAFAGWGFVALRAGGGGPKGVICVLRVLQRRVPEMSSATTFVNSAGSMGLAMCL
jgi:hypothetical protein